MKDNKLQDAIDYVCSCCPYTDVACDYDDVSDKYCDRCMVRKMTDYYNALDNREWSEDMPEYQAIVNY